MAYIGNSPDAIQNSIEITRFNGTSACTQFQIPQDVDDAKAIEVLVNSVQQDPDNSYSVVNGLITFTEAPSTGTNNVTVLRRTGLTYTRTQIEAGDILASAVTSTAIADGAVTGPKLGLTAINANNIVNGTITGTKLAANTVTGDVLGQNSVSSNNIISSITLTTPILGTPASGNLNSCTADGTNPVGYRNIPAVGAKTTSYTLTAADVGKFVELGTGGSIVVPASVFAAGDAISIFNNTSGSISCTCSAVTTFYKGGTDADINSFSVTTRGVATILFISATVAVVTGNLA